MTTRREGVPRAPWRTLRNATLFAADVAKLAAVQHGELIKQGAREALELKIRENTGERLSPDETRRASLYETLRDRFLLSRTSTVDVQSAIFDLIDLVGKLWERPDRSSNSIANKVHGVHVLGRRARLDAGAITQLELHYRLLDLDPEQRLGENQRLAFEAAWLSGQRQFARKLVEQELRTP